MRRPQGSLDEISQSVANHSNDGPSTSSPRQDFDSQIELLSLLEDPVRRSLYAYVAQQGDYVSREDAARAVGIGRGLAAFHLDKLAEEGLLETIYRRPAGRTGPGAGRPAKLYRRSQKQVTVSVPPRDYELIAHLLASALSQELPTPISDDLARPAREAGAVLATETRRLAGRRANRRRLLEAGLEVLRHQGYEPKRSGPAIELRNCPFHSVARNHEKLVCALNLAMLDAFATDLRVSRFAARAQPHDDCCCVVFDIGSRPEG
jgi:predicted ArsR family transcriptional regulator